MINAGGVIDVFYQRTGFVQEKVRKHVGGIYDTLMEIFERAEQEERPTQEVADAIAEERFRKRCAGRDRGRPPRRPSQEANVTGVTVMATELFSKQLLRDLRPAATSVGWILVLNPPLLRPIAWSSPSFFGRRHCAGARVR